MKTIRMEAPSLETWVKNKGGALGEDRKVPRCGQNQGGEQQWLPEFSGYTRRQTYSVSSHEMSQGSIRMESMVGKGLERFRHLLGVGLDCGYGHHCYYPCFSMVCLSLV